MDGEWMDEWRDGDGWGKASPASASARKGKWVALALAGGRSNDESGAVPVIYSTPSDGASMAWRCWAGISKVELSCERGMEQIARTFWGKGMRLHLDVSCRLLRERQILPTYIRINPMVCTVCTDYQLSHLIIRVVLEP